MSEQLDTTDETHSLRPTRRQVIATLGAAGVLGATTASAQQSGGGLTAGGGDMADEMADSIVRWYERAESNLPSAGVDGRFAQITQGGSQFEAGDVVRDNGSSWSKIDLGVGSLSAEDVWSDEGWGESLYVVGDQYDTITAALDAQTTIDSTIGAVLLPPGEYNEALDIEKAHQTIFTFTLQAGANVRTSGSHTITDQTGADDIHLRGIGVYQDDGVYNDPTATTPEQYDAVHITQQEFRAENVSVDTADRAAYYLDGTNRSHILNAEIAGGHVAGVILDDASSCEVKGIILDNTVGDGIYLTTSGGNCYGNHIEANAYFTAGDALVIDSDVHNNSVDMTVLGPDGRMALINGRTNQIRLTGRGGSIEIGGRNNIITAKTREDITFTSGSDYNTVILNNFSFGSGTVTLAGEENQVYGWPLNLDYQGTRCIYNGHSQNGGDPRSSGDWNGNAELAHRLGVTVWDTSTSPWTEYQAAGDGSGGYEFVQS